MTQLQTNATITVSLAVDQVLTVSASTLGLASVVRLRSPGAGDPYTPAALLSGQSSVFGPFSEPSVFRVSCLAGTVQYNIGLQDNIGSVFGLVANDLSAAAANTAALQVALTTGGYVPLFAPGTYYIDAVLTVPSNTSVYIGAGDNAVGITIDCTDAVAFPGGNAYNFAYQSPGDIYDVTIRRGYGESLCEDGAFGVVAMYGPAAYYYTGVQVDGVTGLGSSAIQLGNYAATGQNQLNISRLEVSNVHTLMTCVEIPASTVVNIGELVLNGIVVTREDLPAYRADPTATGTIRSLVMRNVTFSPYDNATFTRTAPLVRFGGVNIGALQISNTEGIVMEANIKCFEADGAANIPKVGIRDCSATGTGTAHLWGRYWRRHGSSPGLQQRNLQRRGTVMSSSPVNK